MDHNTLQWGRAQMSAEIQSTLPTSSATSFASMGPRSDERGNMTMEANDPSGVLSFNGAALR